jgi:hypothetical protein
MTKFLHRVGANFMKLAPGERLAAVLLEPCAPGRPEFMAACGA